VLTAFIRAFKTPDLRKKLLFTLAIMAIFRLGSHVPTPGVSYIDIQKCQNGPGATTGFLGLANLFSGGALLQLSVFALGIMPYITASIIIQLLVVVIPRFETLKKEGQSGTSKLTQYTRYLTIGLACCSRDVRDPAPQPLGSCSATPPARASCRTRACHDPDHDPHHDRRHRRDHVDG
jgi:preprotein translocase subunit SecY